MLMTMPRSGGVQCSALPFLLVVCLSVVMVGQAGAVLDTTSSITTPVPSGQGTDSVPVEAAVAGDDPAEAGLDDGWDTVSMDEAGRGVAVDDAPFRAPPVPAAVGHGLE